MKRYLFFNWFPLAILLLAVSFLLWAETFIFRQSPKPISHEAEYRGYCTLPIEECLQAIGGLHRKLLAEEQE